MDNAAVLQRTNVGLETIKTKSIRLTQSERLILIIVDGVTPYRVLREKVWALSAERFNRAFNTLLEKNLIFEVLLRDENQQPEKLDSAIVDRFLEQDALDPVTIISFDPEDHFGSDLIAEMGKEILSQTSNPAGPSQTPSTANPSNPASPPLPPLDPHKEEIKSSPPLSHELGMTPVKPTGIVSSVPEIKATSKVQAASPIAQAPLGNPAMQSPRHSGQPKIKLSPDRQPAEKPDTAHKSQPKQLTAPRRDALPNAMLKSHSKNSGQYRSLTVKASAARTWSDVLLKFCCWTSVASGIAIFTLLIFRYYGIG